MALANASTAFSIPLVSSVPLGFSAGSGSFLRDDFIGDQTNLPLKYLTNPDLMLPSDWPLVLFGPNGTGKTALGTTLAARLAEGSDDKPFICTADDFRQRLASAIDTGSVAQFRDSVCSSSVLFIDDLHRLIGYEKAESELTTLLETLDRRAIPCVFTVNEKFLEGNMLDQRLISRLSSGLCLPVKLPGCQARKLLFADAAQALELELSDEELEFLAANVTLSFPRMRSFLATFHTWQASRTVNVETEFRLADFLSSWINVDGGDSSLLDEVLGEVARAFRIKRSDITSSSRKKTIVRARGVATYLLRHLFHFSYARIGSMFGGRDHSTVMHAIGRINDQILVDPQFKILVDNLRQTAIEKVLIRSISICE